MASSHAKRLAAALACLLTACAGGPISDLPFGSDGKHDEDSPTQGATAGSGGGLDGGLSGAPQDASSGAIDRGADAGAGDAGAPLDGEVGDAGDQLRSLLDAGAPPVSKGVR